MFLTLTHSDQTEPSAPSFALLAKGGIPLQMIPGALSLSICNH
jgi:hypothetical protein